MRGLIKTTQVLFIILFLSLALGTKPTIAQAGTASEMIATVNSLRQSQGLAAYTVSSYLMGFAQSHSDYMASLGTWTHIRADGSTAFDYGIKENVAMGTDMSVSHCVYSVWSDAVHWQTMVGYETGSVGAGVAFSNGNVFYTLNVLPGGTTISDNTTQEEEEPVVFVQEQQNTPVYISQVITNTPNPDGIISHVVQYGETLWSIAIAYDVTIDEILRNSSLPLGTTEVFEGQRLLIRPATDPTEAPTNSPTAIPPTPTPTQPRPTMTPFPTRTPMPTFTPTSPPSLITRTLGETRIVALSLILISGLGLILVIYFGFVKKS
jgi:LysM repeat protein